MSDKTVDYKKKMKLYESLGAKKFKKLVLEAEKIRWRITKKVFPNYLSNYEKISGKIIKNKLAKATSEEERSAIINYYRHQILIARREYNNEENRNYHMILKRPTEIIKYLKYNKSIHKNALIRNFVIAIAASGFIVSGVGTGIAIGCIGIQALCAIKNWQCINLQNYNLCRFENHREGLEKVEKRREKIYETKYGEAAKAIQKAFDNTREESRIPTVSEVVGAIDSPEQLRQMKKWIESIKNTHIDEVKVTESRKGAK